jgi:hypothetical protein
MGRQFTQGDVERAVRGALKAGMVVGRAEIDLLSGRIILIAGTDLPEQVDPVRDELAAWRASHGNC